MRAPVRDATVALMDLSIFFAGTAGSVPSPRRGLPALLVRRGGEKLLFDCGEGTQRQLLKSVGLREREAPLMLLGPRGLKQLIGSMRAAFGRLPYELKLAELEPGASVR